MCSFWGIDKVVYRERGYREANKGGRQECKDDQKLYPCVQSASPLLALWVEKFHAGRGARDHHRIIIKGEERHNQRNAVNGSVVDRDLVRVECHVKVSITTALSCVTSTSSQIIRRITSR